MAEKQKKYFHTIRFKLNVVEYVKTYGNSVAAWYLGEPPAEKMVRDWRKQEEQMKAARHCKHCLHRGIVKWPEQEKLLVLDQRNLGFSIFIIQES